MGGGASARCWGDEEEGRERTERVRKGDAPVCRRSFVNPGRQSSGAASSAESTAALTSRVSDLASLTRDSRVYRSAGASVHGARRNNRARKEAERTSSCASASSSRISRCRPSVCVSSLTAGPLAAEGAGAAVPTASGAGADATRAGGAGPAAADVDAPIADVVTRVDGARAWPSLKERVRSEVRRDAVATTGGRRATDDELACGSRAQTSLRVGAVPEAALLG